MNTHHHHFNYIELPAVDLAAMKAFYGNAFGWTFQDWGDSYSSIQGAGVEGGLDGTLKERKPSNQGALVVLFSEDIGVSEKKVVAAGGKITVPIFSFPGGRRFHFCDPSGNELAIWTPANTES